jgi:hypothetical protein
MGHGLIRHDPIERHEMWSADSSPGRAIRLPRSTVRCLFSTGAKNDRAGFVQAAGVTEAAGEECDQ